MSDVIGTEDSLRLRGGPRSATAGESRTPAGQAIPSAPPSPHAVRMARFYRRQAALFDVTRAPVLLGRRRLPRAVRTGSTVLEVGCGTGHNLAALRRAVGPGGHVVAVECAPAMVSRARRRRLSGVELHEAEYGDACAATRGRRFDAIVFAYTLSMVPDFAATLRAARANLRPGGEILLLDFTDSPFRFVRAAMRSCGVELGTARFDCLRRGFDIERFETIRAWGGLWSYHFAMARRPVRVQALSTSHPSEP